jgi:hypothetical protein
MSKRYDLQKSLFGEIVFDDDLRIKKTTPGCMNDDN